MYVINNKTCFVVMIFFFEMLYIDYDLIFVVWVVIIFLKNYFLSTETVVNSVHKLHADKFNTKNVI